ncbi:hypothetical protein [Streptomyces sp. NPDC055287]
MPRPTRRRPRTVLLAMVAPGDHSALKLAGYVNTAARRAHTERPRVLALYDIT